jgi:anti-sigma B factor antagonist
VECKGGESRVGRYRLSDHGEPVQVTLDLETRQTDKGVTVLAPSGRLDVAGAPALKDAVSQAMKGGQLRLIIDMEGVSFVDSSGLGSVIAALKQVRSSKGDLRLAAPNQQVRVVLELTTLDRVFPYYATVEEALTDF